MMIETKTTGYKTVMNVDFPMTAVLGTVDNFGKIVGYSVTRVDGHSGIADGYREFKTKSQAHAYFDRLPEAASRLNESFVPPLR